MIILASASPRRKELLSALGVEFDIHPARGPEHTPEQGDPARTVMDLALAKAREVAAQYPDALVIGADTVVEKDGRILGKPAGRAEAAAMLQDLSGAVHRVYTGLALVQGDRTSCRAEETRVRFRTLRPEEIRAYAESDEPMDKAGAYAIQGKASLFVQGIEGDYFNVVGLPLCLLGEMLEEFGVRLL